MYEPTCILVTGGAGFIASNVLQLLVSKYPRIRFVNYDILDYCSCLKNVENLNNEPNYKFIKGDITDFDFVNFVLNRENVDTIMHFAAQTHVCNSFGNSIKFTHTNVMGTHVLLECAKQCNIRRFIHVSTDEVVGEDKIGIAMDEESKMNPSNPYAASKAGAELLVKSYYHSFGLPIIITRGNNVYGKHQYPEKMIPKFINQLKRGLPLTIHGSGSNFRNFLHCEDVARAFEILLFKGEIGEIYNIGGSNEFRNIDVANHIIRTMFPELNEEEKEKMIIYVEDRNFNDFRYHITSDKLKALGWVEQINFEDGLKSTIDWYHENIDRFGDIDNALRAHPNL